MTIAVDLGRKQQNKQTIIEFLLYCLYIQFKTYVYFISNIEQLGNRFTKVMRLSSESHLYFGMICMRTIIVSYVHMLLYKNEIKV